MWETSVKKLNTILKDKIPNGWKFVLPTEAQWEFAARGGKKKNNNKFAGTNMEALLPFYCWFDQNSRGTTHRVGLRKPNELDIFDMCGNVWEWCYDYYAEYPKGKYINPKGPNSGYSRIERGGSYIELPNECQVTSRRWSVSYTSDDGIGFRLCLSKV